MDEPRAAFSIRDAVWLVVLALVLAVWGWDRGRLSQRVELMMNPPRSPVQPPSGPAWTLTLLPYIEQQSLPATPDPFAPSTIGSDR